MKFTFAFPLLLALPKVKTFFENTNKVIYYTHVPLPLLAFKLKTEVNKGKGGYLINNKYNNICIRLAIYELILVALKWPSPIQN